MDLYGFISFNIVIIINYYKYLKIWLHQMLLPIKEINFIQILFDIIIDKLHGIKCSMVSKLGTKHDNQT